MFDNAILSLSVDQQRDDVIFRADLASVELSLLQGSKVNLMATDLKIEADGDASITSAEGFFGDGLASSFGLGGLLPIDVTHVLIEGRDEDGLPGPDPQSLNNLNSDITVDGFFDFSQFDSLPFIPSARIGSGPINTFGATFRQSGNTIQPWNTGPIMIAFGTQSTPVELEENFSLGGSLTLGGFVDGQWLDNISGNLTASVVLLDEDGNQTDAATGIVTVDGTLDITTGTLNLDGMVTFDGEVSGQIGGFEVSGGTLEFDLLLDVDRTAAGAFFVRRF